MVDPMFVVIRDGLPYLPMAAAVLAQFAVPGRFPGRCRVPSAFAAGPRPDASWFLPVHLWGLAAVHHGWSVLFGDSIPGCWGVPTAVFASHAAASWAIFTVVVPLCLLSEHVGRPRHVEAPWRTTIPMSVLAIALGVSGCWLALFLALIPLPQ